jgi:hypothetical protein
MDKPFQKGNARTVAAINQHMFPDPWKQQDTAEQELLCQAIEGKFTPEFLPQALSEVRRIYQSKKKGRLR